ncbi:toll/interleukin-1 receptor domain-containing protein [Actinoplanes bogorensis]|uniref:Toll/interleukin-1 receptor domain-containing protein n=1 Tax=Paractinoplanes bogorensis TaxID=1610840 RepID=A0ABS5Z5K9_9ACTN|nr:toll/interleukin-1 receptor domain-containing protein [Actinoplanes bogorensis]MBU2670975.1 toll/interleukin-1 receptor domain-containing protein [Actinoplanes bogorensis]
MDWNLIVAIISMIAGVLAAWLAYVAVRGRVRRRKTTLSKIAPPTGSYDVFVSYAEDDKDRATWLANGLQSRGLQVFLKEWVGPGLIEQAEQERALDATANGVLLFSTSTMTQPDIRQEYAALLERVHTTGRRFVPVLIDDVDLPPFARIRKPLDLTDRRHDDANLDRLAQALRT